MERLLETLPRKYERSLDISKILKHPDGKAFASVKRCCKNSTLFCSKLIALSKSFKRNLNYQSSITYVALYEEEPEVHWTFN
ncbi:hypothetical protein PX690_21335 [Bacillus velezensis]|uniref:hypothetical protein n=1 Tax=Bacillus velezensis TaxID=492670 RepID=UPI0023E0EDF1|nr:hypothetical protein [Bacillus velezensis]WES02019.1 hypothetical protein PX690_21335 [Bacillus velezensis]